MKIDFRNIAYGITLLATLSVMSVSQAAIYNMSYTGWFTLYNPDGDPVFNADATDTEMLGWRTPVTGTATWDDVAQVGTDSIDPFNILNGSMSVDTVIANPIGDGMGGDGPLVLGNTQASWNGFITFSNIPISNVADLSGIFSAINNGVSVGDKITGGSLPASNDTLFGTAESGFFTLPIGYAPMASTFFNTSNGGFPLTLDSVPGSPMTTFPFTNYSGAFDLTELTVTSISAVPVPGTIWLFISGIIGLFTLKKKRTSI